MREGITLVRPSHPGEVHPSHPGEGHPSHPGEGLPGINEAKGRQLVAPDRIPKITKKEGHFIPEVQIQHFLLYPF